MKRYLLSLLFVFVCAAALAQTVTITFTAQDAVSQYVQLDSVVVKNLTQHWQETVWWPDTVLTVNATRIDNHGKVEEFALLQNHPNPCGGVTDVRVMLPEEGPLFLEITNMHGKITGRFHQKDLPAGTHQFRVTLPAAGTYVMTARHNSKSSSIKMSCNRGGGSSTIVYLGAGSLFTYELKLTTAHPFNYYDRVECMGYAHINNVTAESQHITETPFVTKTITLPFSETQYSLPTVVTDSVYDITLTSAIGSGNVTSDGLTPLLAVGLCWSTSPNPTINDNHTEEGNSLGYFTSNITGLTDSTTYYVRAYATNSVGTAYGNEMSFATPAPFHCGIDTLIDVDGNRYNTLQLGNQCWMKENLRTTRYADGTLIPQAFATALDGAYWHLTYDTATLYGLLYSWPAVVRDPSSAGSQTIVQGICPTGWHVPSVNECYQLSNYVGSQSQYTCNNNQSYVAKALASTKGWYTISTTCAVGNDPSSNNATGFGAMPAGCFHVHNCFYDLYCGAYFWTTDCYSGQSYIMSLTMGSAYVNMYWRDRNNAYSVRCLLD